MERGFVYLTAAVDVASPRVLAQKAVTTLEAHHAMKIIEQALAKLRIPEIVNTDPGGQLTAEKFTHAVLGPGASLPWMAAARSEILRLSSGCGEA